MTLQLARVEVKVELGGEKQVSFILKIIKQTPPQKERVYVKGM